MQPYEPTKAEVMKTRRNIRNSCLWCFSMLCFEPSRDISANIRRTMTTGERNRAGPVDGLQGASASNLSRLRSIRGKVLHPTIILCRRAICRPVVDEC